MTRQLGSAVLLAAILGGAAAARPRQAIEYDTFCKLPDVATKRSAFEAATPDTRATLVRTQIERFRDANQARLTDEQTKAIVELLSTITNETYVDGPAGEAQREKARALTPILMTTFSAADNQAMQPYAPCIAKSK
jgi:hypothetical protein